MSAGTLYVVATPIGNLEDISLRALRILKEADLIAAEDTRHSRKLLTHYGIGTPLMSCHEHNETERAEQFVAMLKQGKSIALISDAGTPAISDPGFLLVRRCRREGLPVASVPGVSAVVTALSIAGMPCDRFEFGGFLPPKKMARMALFETLCYRELLSVFYESPHRLQASLKDLEEVLGPEREVAVARELTKIHEQILRGPVAEVREHFEREGARGEIVLLVGPGQAQAPALSLEEALVSFERGGGLSPKEAVKQAAAQFGLSTAEVYRLRLRLKEEGRL